MKGLIYILVVVLVTSAFHGPPQSYTYEFGIRINPNGSSLITTAIVTVSDKKVIRTEMVSENQFLMEMTGAIHSKANPVPIDLFLKNGIFACSRDKDTIRYKYRQSDTARWRQQKQQGNYKTDYIVQDAKNVDCPLLKELWKIRYSRDIRVKNYMYRQNQKAEGWAADGYFPNAAQINYLRATYGADGINDFIYGEGLYRLMKDIQDSVWVSKYKSLK